MDNVIYIDVINDGLLSAKRMAILSDIYRTMWWERTTWSYAEKKPKWQITIGPLTSRKETRGIKKTLNMYGLQIFLGSIYINYRIHFHATIFNVIKIIKKYLILLMMDLIYGKLILGTVMHIVDILFCIAYKYWLSEFRSWCLLDGVADQMLERLLDEYKSNILYFGILTVKVNPTNFIQNTFIYLWVPSLLL